MSAASWQRPARGARALAWALALALALVAYVEPVRTEGSDGAVQLLAAQALVEHGSTRLDPYVGDPRVAYDLPHDYRVRHVDGALHYYLVAPPWLSAPVVALARALGLDMRVQADEFALQNLLSALLCALLFVQLFELCALLAPGGVALIVTALSFLGGPLTSTLATGLWPASYALVLVLLLLRHVLTRVTPERASRPWWMLVLLAVAYLCRPTTGFVALGLLAYGLARQPAARRRRGLLACLLAALALVAWSIAFWPLLNRLPIYYSPLKVFPVTPWREGFYGVLASPGRGLLVFCPFLVPLGLALLLQAQRLAREPLSWLALGWALPQIVVAAGKPYWWGGHSFGPRLLAEVLVPAALLACLLWRAGAPSGRAARAAWRACLGAYLALGLLAVGVHVGQGLFNPAVQAWNRAPHPRLSRALLFDWHCPQFLASAAHVAARDERLQMEQLQDWPPGAAIAAESTQAVFLDWQARELDWRFTGARSRLRVRPRGFDAGRAYVVELRLHALLAQTLALTGFAGWTRTLAVLPAEPHALRFVLSGRALAGDGVVRELAFDVPGAERAGAHDERWLGVALHRLRITPLEPCPSVSFLQDGCFLEGFADAEPHGRWTRARRVRVRLGPVTPDARRLRLDAGSLGAQRVHASINGHALGTRTFTGAGVESAHWVLPPGVLAAEGDNDVVLALPDAHAPAGDMRTLGLLWRYLEAVPTPAR